MSKRSVTTSLRQQSLRWHNKLGWWSAAALLIWGFSGIAHPLMSWMGPSADKFYPPRLNLSSESLFNLEKTLAALPTAQSTISQVQAVKVLPSATGPVLQLTTTANQPRRYLELASGQPLPHYDQEHAKWLAS